MGLKMSYGGISAYLFMSSAKSVKSDLSKIILFTTCTILARANMYVKWIIEVS